MQKGRYIYSTGSFSLTLVLTALLTVAAAANPFSGFYLLSAALFLFPFYLQLVLRISGPLSALAAISLFCFGTGLKVGSLPALFAFVYLAVPLFVYAYCLYRQYPAFQSMAAIGLAYAAAVLALYAFSFQAFGEAPFDALSRLTLEALDKMPERDGLLSTAYRFGLLSIPDHLAEGAVVQSPRGGAMLSSEVLSELYKQIQTRVSLWLRALVPSLISSFGLWLALGGVFMSAFYGKRKAQRRAFRSPAEAQASLPELTGLPAFHKFFLPKKLAAPLWVAGGLSLLTRFSGQETLALAGAMLYNVFSVLFSVQGLSAVNFLQRGRGVRPPLRALTIAVFTLLLPHAALILGIFDQISDHRKLRTTGPNTNNTDNNDTGRI